MKYLDENLLCLGDDKKIFEKEIKAISQVTKVEGVNLNQCKILHLKEVKLRKLIDFMIYLKKKV